MLAGADAEDLYRVSWGKGVVLGDFRALLITTRSNSTSKFHYPEEILRYMERFKWHDDCHAASHLHPLILASQFFWYFCHTHSKHSLNTLYTL